MSNIRAQWEAAIRTDARWPSSSRVVRGTLLALAAQMRPDGVIRHLPRNALAARVGLPRRTLERHLARAVDLGWLTRRRGQKHQPAEYRAAIPAVSACQEWRAENPSQDATHSCAENPSQDATWWRTHIDRANASEHVAVDEERERRDDHDESRAEGDHDDKDGSNEDQADDRLSVDAAVDLDGLPPRQPSEADPHGDCSSVTREAADTIVDDRLAAFALVRAVLDDDQFAARTISTDPTALALAAELARAVRAVAFTEGVTEHQVIDASVRRIVRLAANP